MIFTQILSPFQILRDQVSIEGSEGLAFLKCEGQSDAAMVPAVAEKYLLKRKSVLNVEIPTPR